jgi:hypothetical protein
MIEVAANAYPKPILGLADMHAAAVMSGIRENGSSFLPAANGASP